MADVLWRDSPQYVYECHQDGEVVYIGCTEHPHRRLVELRRAPWWRQTMTLVVVAAFSDRRAAYQFENFRIRNLRPPFNRQGNPRYGLAALNVPHSTIFGLDREVA